MPTVIEGLLFLHGDSTIVPNSNGKLLIGLLISTGSIWADGFGIVLRVNPAALYMKNWPKWLPIHNFKSFSRGMLDFSISVLVGYNHGCGTR